MEDDEVLGFLRDQAREAMYVTSVCTGSLVLAAAGLLNGLRAETEAKQIQLQIEYNPQLAGEEIEHAAGILGLTSSIFLLL
jgi:transcriptional regulator GlxA family with amidase domain